MENIEKCKFLRLLSSGDLGKHANLYNTNFGNFLGFYGYKIQVLGYIQLKLSENVLFDSIICHFRFLGLISKKGVAPLTLIWVWGL